MALLHDFNFTGPLGDLTFYHMKGCSRPVVRTKGGVSRARLKNDQRYDLSRRNASEFGGRGSVAGHIMRQLRDMRAWETHLLVGEINKWLEPVQKADTVSAKGKRGILFSQAAALLTGMPLSTGAGFDAVVNTPLTSTISREELYARVAIPAIRPGVNLYLPHKQPVYRFVACLLMLPDFVFNEASEAFEPAPGHHAGIKNVVYTDWYPVTEQSEPAPIELKLTHTPPDERFGLMLSVGIQLGALRHGMRIESVKNSGASKVLMMA
jgi:hypothetical protein